MKNRYINPAVRIAVNERSAAGTFPVTVTYESGVESHLAASDLDDVWAIARGHHWENSEVLFRGNSRIAINE